MNFLYYIFLIFIFTLIIIFVFFYFENENIVLENLKTDYNIEKDISEYVIFGTHISNSYNLNNFLKPLVKTQNLDISKQLNTNIRYFDLRFKIIKNDMFSYHNFIYLNSNYKEIFDILIDFLDNNDNEFLILVLKNENYKNHHKIFEFLYFEYIIKYNKNKYFVWNNEKFDLIPKIKDIKKKIFLFNCYKKNNTFQTLTWEKNKIFEINNKIIIEDYYNIENFNKKFEYILKTIEKKNYLKIIYISFQNKSLLGINKQTMIFYKNFKKKILNIILKNNGIYVFDFIDFFL